MSQIKVNSLKRIQPKEKRKLSNYFYICYEELCRSQNLNSLILIKNKSSTNKAVLDLSLDRIKYEDWPPILKALSLDTSLHAVSFKCRQRPKNIAEHIDSESKLNQLPRNRPVILAKFMFEQFIDSVSTFICNTQVLTYLQLEGLPLSRELVSNLAAALGNNKTLQHLSLRYCLIKDNGCEILANLLKNVSNIFTLDLSGSDITHYGVKFLANLINHQKVRRYTEVWKQTLRYREPELDKMKGLRRLTLNDNPQIGDHGLTLLSDVLKDDLWIKAIDLQNCNVTEQGINNVFNMLRTNEILYIFDLRRNSGICEETLCYLMEILNKKQESLNEFCQDYDWLTTTSTTSICSSAYTQNGLRRPSASGFTLKNKLSSCKENAKHKQSTCTDLKLGKKDSQKSKLNIKVNSESATKWNKNSYLMNNYINECKSSLKRALQNDQNHFWNYKNNEEKNEQIIIKLKRQIRDLENQLKIEKDARLNCEELNVQLQAQLMEAMSGSKKLKEISQPCYSNDYVYVKKEFLKTIYKIFEESPFIFSDKIKNNSNKQAIFTSKLQRIIEESPRTIQEDISQMNQYQNNKNTPRVNKIFKSFLDSEDEEDNYDNDDFDSDESETFREGIETCRENKERSDDSYRSDNSQIFSSNTNRNSDYLESNIDCDSEYSCSSESNLINSELNFSIYSNQRPMKVKQCNIR